MFFWYSPKLLIESRILNVSVDSSSLNIFLVSVTHLLKIMKTIHVSSKMYDILGFLNFLYLPQTMQYIYIYIYIYISF